MIAGNSSNLSRTQWRGEGKATRTSTMKQDVHFNVEPIDLNQGYIKKDHVRWNLEDLSSVTRNLHSQFIWELFILNLLLSPPTTL